MKIRSRPQEHESRGLPFAPAAWMIRRTRVSLLDDSSDIKCVLAHGAGSIRLLGMTPEMQTARVSSHDNSHENDR